MNAPTSDQVFRVGEIAIVVATTYAENSYRIGMEVEIIDTLALRIAGNDRKQYYCYRCRYSDGCVSLLLPSELRKKRPPREDLQLVRWSECPWQPEKINAA